MYNRGKMLIALILLVASVAAATAWWYQYSQGQRVLSLWGPESTFRIRMASQCQLVRLSARAPLAAGASDVVVGAQGWSGNAPIEISRSPGFVHARQALIQDASYDWAKTKQLVAEANSVRHAEWEYGIRFQHKDAVTRLEFDLKHNLVRDPDQAVIANIAPIAAGLRAFILEQFSSSESSGLTPSEDANGGIDSGRGASTDRI